MDGRTYRADIDGLRAVAILLVVAYHGGVSTFSGGFVGVDVFFVLSGYLITGLLVAEYQRTGRISLREFYARRVRRLLPLAALVLIVTTIVGLWVVSPLRRASLLADASSSALYVANWRFAGQATAYSDASVTDSLFLHYWSLSVEEQFYFLWPLLVVGVAWLVRRRRPSLFVPLLTVVLSLLVAASLWASITMSYDLGPKAYYATPMRLWEMGLGATFALVAPKLRAPRPAVASGAAVVGMAAILWSAMTYDASTTFPGTAALVPVGGTLLLVWSATSTMTPTARLLSTRPMVRLGKLSYGWYLWHWPALGIGVLLHERGQWSVHAGIVSAAAIIGSLVLAAATLRLVENPIRYAPSLSLRPARSLALGAGLTAAPVALVGMVLVAGVTGSADTPIEDRASLLAASEAPDASEQMTQASLLVPRLAEAGTTSDRFDGRRADQTSTVLADAQSDDDASGPAPERMAELLAARADSARPMTPREASDDSVTIQPEGCNNVYVHDGREIACAVGDVDGDITIGLIGDSHAQHWLPALDVAGKERGWRIVSWTMSACAPIDVALWDGRHERRYHECEQWNDYVADRLVDEGGVDLLVLGRAYGYENRVLDAEGRRLRADEMGPTWTAGATRTFSRLLEHADHLVVLRETPRPTVHVPECLAESPSDPSVCDLPFSEGIGMDARIHGAEAAAAAAVDPDRIGHVDLTDLVCTEDPCSMVQAGGVIRFRDSHHLTQSYSRLLGPEVGEVLAAVLEER